MKNKTIPIKEVILKNNCPECFSNEGLRLTFKQRFIENKFYKSITEDIKQVIDCTNCNTIIYPVQWTIDIERVVEYQKKALTPKKTSRSFKKAFWIILGLVVFIFMIILFLGITYEQL